MGDSSQLFQLVSDFVGNSFVGGVSMVAGVTYTDKTVPDSEIRFLKTLQSNLVLPFNCIKLMKDFLSKDSSVVFFSSINAGLGFPNNPGYVASKAGIAGLTRALATDWAIDGIRVNSLELGYFHTGMTDESHRNPSSFKQRAERSLLNRWGDPNEVLGPAQFLLSKASSFITGQALPVDGGWTIKGL
jgi:NAD(P)-dependent dehydrogenase (short-subunit alcohol dehydrogenase family)